MPGVAVTLRGGGKGWLYAGGGIPGLFSTPSQRIVQISAVFHAATQFFSNSLGYLTFPPPGLEKSLEGGSQPSAFYTNISLKIEQEFERNETCILAEKHNKKI